MPLVRYHNSAAETVKNFMGIGCVFDAETAISSAFLRTIMMHFEQRGKTREKMIADNRALRRRDSILAWANFACE